MHWALIYVLGSGAIFDTNLRYEDIQDCASDWANARKQIDQMKFTSAMDNTIVNAGYCLPVEPSTDSKKPTRQRTFERDS